jgi:hypothetical protein
MFVHTPKRPNSSSIILPYDDTITRKKVVVPKSLRKNQEMNRFYFRRYEYTAAYTAYTKARLETTTIKNEDYLFNTFTY